MMWRLEHKYLEAANDDFFHHRPTDPTNISQPKMHQLNNKKIVRRIWGKIALAKHSVQLDKTETRMECWQSARNDRARWPACGAKTAATEKEQKRCIKRNAWNYCQRTRKKMGKFQKPSKQPWNAMIRGRSPWCSAATVCYTGDRKCGIENVKIVTEIAHLMRMAVANVRNSLLVGSPAVRWQVLHACDTKSTRRTRLIHSG